ncbi:fatty-acyl reductase, partial [Danaus plexippus plexippus]
ALTDAIMLKTLNRCAVVKKYTRTISSKIQGYDEVNKTNTQNVADFYAGKSIFMTGGTGFVGKVLIERLLFNCNDIDKVYVLIREKKGASSDERLKQMFDVPLFDRLKQEKPQAMNKVVPIGGDLSQHDLAIRPEDLEQLVEKVSVVFHSAATVRFNEKIEETMKVNYGGTKKVIELTKKMRNLDVR